MTAAAYDAVFEILAAAEMQLRNGNYWQVARKLEAAALLARDYAMAQSPSAERELDALRKDAERYRWLRERTGGEWERFALPTVPLLPKVNIMCGSVAQHLDDAIDAVMAARSRVGDV